MSQHCKPNEETTVAPSEITMCETSPATICIPDARGDGTFIAEPLRRAVVNESCRRLGAGSIRKEVGFWLRSDGLMAVTENVRAYHSTFHSRAPI
jgi:hypothetical protein